MNGKLNSSKEGKIRIKVTNLELEKKIAASIYKEMVASNQKKDQFWLKLEKMFSQGDINKAQIEMALQEFYDDQ